ncbi:MAG: hypothetical protein Q8J64_09565 [Thermodesulfovibrionales bacterium]|nr:hypothetical protein [Thermodesulfovibrionales bacterium]
MPSKEQIAVERKILKNPAVSATFAAANRVFLVGSTDGIYLVGGYLRDLARGVPPRKIKDIDFVVRRGLLKALVNAVSSELGGTVVELKKERMLRIAFKDGATIDFSIFKKNILNDLKSRDFTFNAISWSPAEGIIDPFGGIRDIKQGIIRGILKNNFKDDPLRLLRTYRFLSELCIPIESSTRKNIRALSALIKYPARERITLEFLKLLNGKCPQKALSAALKDGILTEIISLSFNTLATNINIISKIEPNLNKIPNVRRLTAARFPQDLSYVGLLRLEAVLTGSELKKSLLSLSSAVGKRVDAVSRLRGEFSNLSREDMGREDMGRVFELFGKCGDALTDLLILTGRLDLIKDAQRFLRIKKRGILSSEEIMRLTGIKTGPELGKIINKMKSLQFTGKIRSRAQALKHLKTSKRPEFPA